MQRNMPLAPIQLDSSIAIKLNMGGSMFQERALMGRSDVWHKIKIVRGAHYDKEMVLKAILNTIDPADLIPVKYQINGEDSFFLARNCGPALDKLCRCSLIVKSSNGDPLILIVTLGFASIHDLKVNIQPLLLTTLTKRYDPNKKILNLQEFHKDPDIAKTVYCPLSQLRTFNHVLKLAKNAIATIEYLDLRNNDLLSLSAMEGSNLTFIKYLDLRHNNLMGMETLTPLRSLEISKLWLDGNPLCENYSSPMQYIESARRYCPHLIQLDGVSTGTLNMPLTYSNYFKDERRQELIYKFISHFFNLYDQYDRTYLRGLYHRNAFYSISCDIPSSVAHKKNLSQFTANRNILKTSDPGKRCLHLYHGPEDILIGLKKLPRSFHDRNTFMYDVMYDDNKRIAVLVTGLFKKLNTDPQILSFSRTFLLVAGKDNEYNILNDQYHVSFPPEDTTSESVDVKVMYEEFTPTCFSVSERQELMNQFRSITTLNFDWSQTYLEETNWNIRKAISNFMKDYKSSSVPADAFSR